MSNGFTVDCENMEFYSLHCRVEIAHRTIDFPLETGLERITTADLEFELCDIQDFVACVCVRVECVIRACVESVRSTLVEVSLECCRGGEGDAPKLLVVSTSLVDTSKRSSTLPKG